MEQLLALDNEPATIMDTKILLPGSALVAGILAASHAIGMTLDLDLPVQVPVQLETDMKLHGVPHLIGSERSEAYGPATSFAMKVAEDSTLPGRDPERTMSVKEYELYRAQLLKQMEGVTGNRSATSEAESVIAEPDQDSNQGNGFGQGYRARHRHGRPENSVNRGGQFGAGGGKR
jgi:hypothetical protein